MHAREAVALFITIIAIAAVAVVLQGNPGVSGFIARPAVNTVAPSGDAMRFLLLSNGKVIGGIEITNNICYFWPPSGIGPPSIVGKVQTGLPNPILCYTRLPSGSFSGYWINKNFDEETRVKWSFSTVNLTPAYSGTAIPY